MFIETDELKSAVYQYQLDQITEDDDTIVEMAINAAIEEVKSYLTPNSQNQWADGRRMYDVEAIFSAIAEDRNALVLSLTKTVAKWWVIQLCNADVIYDDVKDRYDRTTAYLKKVNSGEVSIISLPVLDPEGDNVANQQPFRSGSRTKFNHY